VPPCQGGRRGFEPLLPLQTFQEVRRHADGREERQVRVFGEAGEGGWCCLLNLAPTYGLTTVSIPLLAHDLKWNDARDLLREHPLVVYQRASHHSEHWTSVKDRELAAALETLRSKQSAVPAARFFRQNRYADILYRDHRCCAVHGLDLGRASCAASWSRSASAIGKRSASSGIGSPVSRCGGTRSSFADRPNNRLRDSFGRDALLVRTDALPHGVRADPPRASHGSGARGVVRGAGRQPARGSSRRADGPEPAPYPFKDNSFDAAYALSVIEHLDNFCLVFAEL
jgi:hypothetical protein